MIKYFLLAFWNLHEFEKFRGDFISLIISLFSSSTSYLVNNAVVNSLKSILISNLQIRLVGQ